MVESNQVPVSELVAVLPKIENYYSGEEDRILFTLESKLNLDVNAALSKLRDLCGSCPACILAALRQAKIPVPVATNFNFTSEMKDVWADINEANREEYEAG